LSSIAILGEISAAMVWRMPQMTEVSREELGFPSSSPEAEEKEDG
jgi:hypothetical protein